MDERRAVTMEPRVIDRKNVSQRHLATEASDVRVCLLSACELRRIALEYICVAGSGFALVGAAPDLTGNLEQLAASAPDVILIDAELLITDSAQTREQLLRQVRETAPTIVLSGHLDIASACSVIAAGADGYVLTASPIEELLQALQFVAAGGIWLDSDVVRTIASHFAEPQFTEEASHTARLLSSREHQILRSVARGETSKEIAQKLILSESSVRTYWYRVLSKLNAANKAEAVVRAVRLGLLDEAEGEDDDAYIAASPRLRAWLRDHAQSATPE